MKLKFTIPDDVLNVLVQEVLAELKPQLAEALQHRVDVLVKSSNLLDIAYSEIRTALNTVLQGAVREQINALLVQEFGDTYRQRGALRQILLEEAQRLADQK